MVFSFLELAKLKPLPPQKNKETRNDMYQVRLVGGRVSPACLLREGHR